MNRVDYDWELITRFHQLFVYNSNDDQIRLLLFNQLLQRNLLNNIDNIHLVNFVLTFEVGSFLTQIKKYLTQKSIKKG